MHGVAFVRIYDAGLKRAARGWLLQIQDAKSRQKIAIWAPSHNFVGLYLTFIYMYHRAIQKVVHATFSLL